MFNFYFETDEFSSELMGKRTLYLFRFVLFFLILRFLKIFFFFCICAIGADSKVTSPDIHHPVCIAHARLGPGLVTPLMTRTTRPLIFAHASHVAYCTDHLLPCWAVGVSDGSHSSSCDFEGWPH